MAHGEGCFRAGFFFPEGPIKNGLFGYQEWTLTLRSWLQRFEAWKAGPVLSEQRRHQREASKQDLTKWLNLHARRVWTRK